MNTIEKIKDIKKVLGKKLIILAHHYQNKEIVELSDYKGDSFELSQRAGTDKEAEFIVFCGVHFMAESAAILAQKHQTVQIPVPDAGCSMADMIDYAAFKKAWDAISRITGENSVTPIIYMNSDARTKAFCGENGGLVCTSSNADKAVVWALNRREKVFFMPDEHLGRNTANKLGISEKEIIVWDNELHLGGNNQEKIEKARLILWKGFCIVHTRFNVEHIKKARENFSDAKIIVHPECVQDAVKLADASGSTKYIIDYVKNAPKNSTIIIGTEINMIKRLANEYSDKKILPLYESVCPNMHKTVPHNLLSILENIGEKNIVFVEEAVKRGAKLALDRMLAL